MSDGAQVSQALAELWDIVRCRCHEAYTGRGLHDPACECDSTDAVQAVADRIEALTEQLTAARADAKEAEAYAEELESDRRKTYEALLLMSGLHSEVEAKLARAEWLLTDAMVQLEEGKIKTRRNRARLIREFLSETKGENK